MHEKLKISLVVLTGFCLFSACSEEDIGGGVPPAPISIGVSDGGYSGNGTRAVPEGYHTMFTIGDSIGIFAFGKDGTALLSNEPLVFDGQHWSAKSPLELGDIATCFAYYPYVSADSLTALGMAVRTGGTKDVTADVVEAASFFAPLVTNWKPLKSQRTLDSYAASDLMIARGSVIVARDSVGFNMAHVMALAVISGEASEGLTTEFRGDRQPLAFGGDFRYILRPDQDKDTLLIATTAETDTMKLPLPKIKAGHYHRIQPVMKK